MQSIESSKSKFPETQSYGRKAQQADSPEGGIVLEGRMPSAASLDGRGIETTRDGLLLPSAKAGRNKE